MKNRKLAFFEIGHGRFAKDVQEDFEKAQKLSVKHGVPVKIKVEVTINPPAPNDENYSTVSYSHQLVNPKNKSKVHSVVVMGDTIISNSQLPPEQMDLLDLKFPQDEPEKVLSFDQSKTN